MLKEELNKDSYPQAAPVSENTQRTVITNAPLSNIIEDQLKMEIYNRARLTKLLSLIDILFQIISLGIAISQNTNIVYFFIFFPLCLCGFFGAKYYKKMYILAYAAYLLIMTIIYFAITIYTGSLWFLLFFAVELYLFYYVGKLYNYLNKISDDTKNSLKDGWKPDNIVILYY